MKLNCEENWRELFGRTNYAVECWSKLYWRAWTAVDIDVDTDALLERIQNELTRLNATVIDYALRKGVNLDAAQSLKKKLVVEPTGHLLKDIRDFRALLSIQIESGPYKLRTKFPDLWMKLEQLQTHLQSCPQNQQHDFT